MADRWSRVYERPIVSSYVPLPLENIENNYRRQQHEYDKGIEDIQDAQSLIKVNADPLHTPHRNKLIQDYNNQISQLADEYIKTGGSPETKYKVHNLKRQFANDPNRLQLESNYQNYLQYQKDKEERYSKGEYDPLSKEYDPYKYIQPKEDRVTPFSYTGMKGVQKHYPVIQDMMKGIKPSGTSKEWYDIDESGNVIGKKAGWEQIARQDVDRVAAAKVPLFLQHQDSQYFKDKFLAEHPNATQQDLSLAAFDNLKREGENQIFANTKSAKDFQYAPEYIGNKKSEAEILGTSTQSEALTGDLIEDKSKDIQFDEKGNLKPVKTTTYTSEATPFGSSIPGMSPGVRVTPKGESKIDINKTIENENFIKSLDENHPELRDLKPKEKVEAYRKAIKSQSEESIPLISMSNVAKKNIGEALVNNKLQRNFYLYDDKGKTLDGTFKTVLEELDIPEEEFDKQLEKGISGYTQAGPVAGSYYIEVKNSDGETRRVMISPDEEAKTIFRTSQAINEARKSFTPTTITPFESRPDVKIAVIPQIKKDGKVSTRYVKYIADENGEPIQSEETTLDEIRKAEREVYKNSGYLGSETTVLKPHTTQ